MKKAIMKARTLNVEEIPELYRDLVCDIEDCEGDEDEVFFYKCRFFKGFRSETTIWIDSELITVL